MYQVLFFIFMLPVKLSTCTVIIAWFICFGIFKILNIGSSKYDDWYEENLTKMINVLKME